MYVNGQKTIFRSSISNYEDVRLFNLFIQRFSRDIPLVVQIGKKIEKFSNSVPIFKRIPREPNGLGS